MKTKTLHHGILLLFFIIFSVNASASILGSIFGGGSSSSSNGTDTQPYELIVGGTKRNDDKPDKYYKFYSAVNQNITVHISDHTSNIFGKDTSQDLSLKLYATDSNNNCTSSDINSTTQKGDFEWNSLATTGGKFYCLSTKNSDLLSADTYDIRITSDAVLKAAISDASAHEDSGTISFLVGLTHATTTDTIISYSLHDHTAKNGVNYNGTDGTVTIPAGQDSATININLINTNMSTTKDFTITISSSSLTVDNAEATGTIIGSSSVSDGDNTYNGPDICYGSREHSGFCMFGSCLFYKETTNIQAMVNGLDNIDIKKSLTRGIAFMDFASGIGIDGNKKTLDSGDDQAEKKSFVNADFLDSSFFNASMFPNGIEYRVGNGANTSSGGSLNKNATTSYYDKSLFKFGLFTQYTHIVTYEKNGKKYQEVLQACNPDVSGSLTPAPTISQCGVFVNALNSHTKITFDTASGIWQTINSTTNHELNTPTLINTNNTALCNNQSCQADGIGSTPIALPAFQNSTETANVNIPYSMVIAEQQIGNLTTTTTNKTKSPESERTMVFEAPYSSSYGSRVMFIHSISDHDAHADTYHYVFKEGDYWINSWDINKAKNVTIETVGNVRFFIKNNFTITNSGALNIGHSGSSTSSKFYMYIYGDFTTNVTGATAIQNGYVYTKGTLTLGSTSTIALDWGALTADGELKISNGAPSTFNYASDDVHNIFFNECAGGDGSAYITGPFDAWDTFRDNATVPPTDRNISTKIVNKPFKLSLATLNKDNNAYELKEGTGSVDVAIYPKNSTQAISNHINFNVSNERHISSSNNINISTAQKNALVGFKLCATYEKNTTTEKTSYILFPNTSCNDSSLNDCNASTSGVPTWHICYSSDNFAIRPNKLDITNSSSKIIAGKDFNITIKALDYDGNPTNNYNETLTIRGNSPCLDYNDTNILKGCINGNLIGENLSFKNGEANTTLKYSEVGDLRLILKEINGNEFANIDADDTNKSQRFIQGYNKTITVVPDHFKINASYHTLNNIFTYISKDLNMSSILDINITANSFNNNITKNYNSVCYAKSTNYKISYENPIIKPSDALTKILYIETNTSMGGNNNIGSDINFKDIPKSIFSTDHNGTGSIHIKINFNRDTTKAVNPFILKIKEINVTDLNNKNGYKNLNQNITFLYERVHSQRERYKGAEGNAQIYYETYCDISQEGDKSLLPNGTNSTYNDDPRWFNNTKHNTPIDGQIININQKGYTPSQGYVYLKPGTTISTGTPAKIILHYNEKNGYPYKTTMEINASNWLIYNKYNKNAKENEFEVEFINNSADWAGEHETNSTTKKNAADITNRRLMW